LRSCLAVKLRTLGTSDRQIHPAGPTTLPGDFTQRGGIMEKHARTRNALGRLLVVTVSILVLLPILPSPGATAVPRLPTQLETANEAEPASPEVTCTALCTAPARGLVTAKLGLTPSP